LLVINLLSLLTLLVCSFNGQTQNVKVYNVKGKNINRLIKI